MTVNPYYKFKQDDGEQARLMNYGEIKMGIQGIIFPKGHAISTGGLEFKWQPGCPDA